MARHDAPTERRKVQPPGGGIPHHQLAIDARVGRQSVVRSTGTRSGKYRVSSAPRRNHNRPPAYTARQPSHFGSQHGSRTEAGHSASVA
jgi:hypothetical protein